MAPSGIRTAYLGQFSWERANAIAARLEEAGIEWGHKQSGTLGRLLFAEWGVRMFADASRIDEAKQIAAETPEPPPGAPIPGPGDKE